MESKRESLFLDLKFLSLQRLVLRGIFWRGVYFATLLVLSVLMSRYYLAPGSGQIFYTITLLAWVSLILSFCMEVGMNYFLASQQISASKLTGLAILWALAAGAVSYLLFSLLSKKHTFSGSNIILFKFSSVYIIGNLFITFFSALFNALKKLIIPNIVMIISNVILIFLVPKKPLLDINQDLFINIYLFSFLIQGIFLFILFLINNVREFKVSLPNIAEMKLLMEFSTWAFFTNALTMLLYRIDYWFVHHYCGALN